MKPCGIDTTFLTQVDMTPQHGQGHEPVCCWTTRRESLIQAPFEPDAIAQQHRSLQDRGLQTIDRSIAMLDSSARRRVIGVFSRWAVFGHRKLPRAHRVSLTQTGSLISTLKDPEMWPLRPGAIYHHHQDCSTIQILFHLYNAREDDTLELVTRTDSRRYHSFHFPPVLAGDVLSTSQTSP